MPRVRAGLTMSHIRRLIEPLFVAAALVAVLLESTLWRWLEVLGQRLSRLGIFAALERLIDRLSPTAVIIVFVLPFVPMIPLLKFTEFWLLEHHHFIWATVVIIGAKVIGAAFSTRVFAIARPKMRQVAWFARADAAVVRLIDLGHRTLDAIPAWVFARAQVRRARLAVVAWWRGWWGLG
ncbi:hypothetical protein ACQW02_23585 [Humitalea sp. 24SJ18S-53]|uniref:hypothetical protein n=1 Tax=Humitalea sp. 24SJ18S-53 TaxID=3422307 RepID=UPI003D67D832